MRVARSLSKEARKHWRRRAAILSPLGLLTPADADSFSMLVNALALVDKSRVEIARPDSEVLAHKDRIVLNPWLSVMRSAEASAAKLFSEFGLTPSARTRLFSAAVHPVPTMHQTPDIADVYFEDEQQDSVQ